MRHRKILIVDDENLVRWSLREKCVEWGYQVLEAECGAEGLAAADKEAPDLVLLDVRLPDLGGLEVLEKLKHVGDSCAVIMITADPQIDDVKAAIKMGAYDYVGKPLDFEELGVTIQNALEALRLRTEVESLRGVIRARAATHEVVAKAPKMLELMEFVGKVSRSEATTILIQGESGTGKDLVARSIHEQSSRQASPFVAINCSAIPETLMESELFGHERGAFTDAKATKKGLFEVADSGTIFLDEIGELSPFLQAKLLRVLEDQVIRRVGGVRDIQVDVRVIAASNRDLERAVEEGRFRQDLYYRLAIISVLIPPLRDRREDILPLADFFIQHFNRKFHKSVRGISDEARHCLMNYHFPGNVRELKNALERAMILEDEPILQASLMPCIAGRANGRVRQIEDAPSASAGEPSHDGRSVPPLFIPEGGTTLEGVEHALVELALRQAEGNQTRAAQLLDISRDALRYKMKKFGLAHADETESPVDAA